MLSRKKPQPVPADPEPIEVEPRPGSKGRPTPKRRDQEAARRRPLVDDGKAATAAQKARRKEARAKAREGMMRGDERYLGPRDRGPMRRFLRDSVDSRWNIGEVLLPCMLVILALTVVPTAWAQSAMFFLAYGLIMFGILDTVLLWRRTKRRAIEAFGEEPGKGSAMYVAMRAFQMRMSRVPRAQLKRGDPVVPRR